MLEEFYKEPLFGVAITVIAYVVAKAVHARWRKVNSLFLTCGMLIALLVVCHIPYESYENGGKLITFFLGPATIALGVPLYKNAQRIKSHMVGIISGVTAGSVSGIISAGAIAWALGAPRDIVLSMIPKSVTAPVAIEIVAELGGIPELGATFAVLTGLAGSMIGPVVLRLFGVNQHIPLGTAVGTASHGIGTAKLIRESELKGSVSGLAMGLTAILIPIIMIPLYPIIRYIW